MQISGLRASRQMRSDATHCEVQKQSSREDAIVAKLLKEATDPMVETLKKLLASIWETN